MEFIIGTIVVIVIAVCLAVSDNKKDESKDINSTVLPLPPKPPTGNPE